MSMNKRKKETRHALRDNEHYTLDTITEKLYNNEKIGKPKMKWINGHSWNTLHELADRHAARISFRTNKIPRNKKKSVFHVLLPNVW